MNRINTKQAMKSLISQTSIHPSLEGESYGPPIVTYRYPDRISLDAIVSISYKRLDLLEYYMKAILIPCVAKGLSTKAFMSFGEFEAWHIVLMRSGIDIYNINLTLS